MGNHHSNNEADTQEIAVQQAEPENAVEEVVNENQSSGENEEDDTSSNDSSDNSNTQLNEQDSPGVTPKQKAGYNLCCVIKAKTREHADTPECKKSIWFEGKLGGVLKIGTSSDCGLMLKDDRCEKTHALIRCKKREENGIIFSDLVIYPCARMYRLTSPQEKNKIGLGSVIKLGSISFAVINLNAADGSEFRSGKSYLEPYLLNIYQSENGFLVGRKQKNKKKAIESSRYDSYSEEDKPKEVKKEKLEDCVCYICWNSPDLTQHKIINEIENEVIDFSQSTSTDMLSSELENLVIDESSSKANKPTEDDNVDEPIPTDIKEEAVEAEETSDEFNPMILNPCGTCTGSSQYIHYKCLMQWIKSSKSGHCSICNGVLPYEFSSKPPNIELKLIRHRRGQRWVGNRRFRLSFSNRNSQSIGSSTRCDVTLPDMSVSDHHANIFFDRETREFSVKDCNSKGGTYLQLTEPLVLNDISEEYFIRRAANSNHYNLVPPGVGFNEFKMGRTTLSIKVVQSKDKKSTLHKLLQRPSLMPSHRMNIGS